MQIAVTFKNMNSSKHFKTYVEEKFSRIDKLLQTPGSASVVLRAEKLQHIAEVALTGDRMTVHAREEHEDLHAAIDLVTDKVRKQITKNKEKYITRRTRLIAKPEPVSEAPAV